LRRTSPSVTTTASGSRHAGRKLQRKRKLAEHKESNMSDFQKYLKQLKNAKSDAIAEGPGGPINGELTRLARLAANSQAPVERKQIIEALRAKGAELGVDVSGAIEAVNYPVGSPYRIQ
jgi:hypothetical protein